MSRGPMTQRAIDTVSRAKAKKDLTMEALGKQIRDLRVSRGLRVETIAGRAGISWGGWKKLEEGEAVSVLVLFKAAEALNCELFIDMEENF